MKFVYLSGVLLSLFLLLTGGRAPKFSEPGCVIPVSEYYTIDLVSTKKVPGSGEARGKGEVTFASTPFGIALSDDGSYRYELAISIEKLRPPKRGQYIAWVTTPQLDSIELIGPLDDQHSASGKVEWNKFLVVITLEDTYSGNESIWSGPVVLRGVSRSGLMHTMAGHGPFEDEPCALYGY